MPEQDIVFDESSSNSSEAPIKTVAALTPQATCREVERMSSKEVGDHVKCAHLFGTYYRCNWWARSKADRATGVHNWEVQLDEVVRKSSFMKVTMAGGKLVIEEVTARSGRLGSD